jgi:hypothetical protein
MSARCFDKLTAAETTCTHGLDNVNSLNTKETRGSGRVSNTELSSSGIFESIGNPTSYLMVTISVTKKFIFG